MLPWLLDSIKRREERVVIGEHALIVRELASAADVSAMADNSDMSYKLVVRCTFSEDGALAFTDEDIPALKDGAKLALLPLINAVARVNGMDAADNEKNSEAAPSSGSSTS